MTQTLILPADDPRHGKYAGALAHWRNNEVACGPCLRASRRQNKGALIDRLAGRPRMVTLGADAVEVIHQVPLAQLEDMTGIRGDRLIRYRHAGPDGRVHRSTRDRLLAAGRRDYWTPIGIQRRVQALNALGWSMPQIAAVATSDLDALKRLRNREAQVFVRREFAQTVLRAYDELSMKVPPTGAPATRTRRLAEKRGWPPPLAWNNIDDPAEDPSDWRYQPADRAEHLADLDARHAGITEVCAELGIRRDSVERWCERHGLRAMYVRFMERETPMVERRNQWSA